MFLRVNGLFGWVQANDRRSMVLFAGFVLALNLAAALILVLPLSGLDTAHAPFFAWGGYFIRYVPIVTLLGVGCFALQMAWHVRSVQKLVAFAFVDDTDEPRLCSIVEPLAITIGLPAPYVGVVNSPALNAFACGLSRNNAVVVVTRGLIEELDDDELAAVVAHELAHIDNGDIRLLAAANVCLRMVGWLAHTSAKRPKPISQLAAFPLMTWIMPPLAIAVLIVGLCGQAAIRGSHLIRLLITSSREFIADAAAVEATQNPSALVSALRRIEGRSALGPLSPGQDAMMIDGANEGTFATHPTIDERVRALVAVTGSMALIAPARRDTRPNVAGARVGFGRRGVAQVAIDDVSQIRQGPLGRIASGDDRNWFGLTKLTTVGAILSIFLFFGLHREELTNPRALAMALDPRPVGAMLGAASRGQICGLMSMSDLARHKSADTVNERQSNPDICDPKALRRFNDEQAKIGGPIGTMMRSMTTPPPGEYVGEQGGFTNVPPPAVKAGWVRADQCFDTKPYKPGDAGFQDVNAPRSASDNYNIHRWLETTQTLAATALTASDTSRDTLLRKYLEMRMTNYETIDHFYGLPGIALLQQRITTPQQQQAVSLLRSRLSDPSFVAMLSPVEHADAELLVTRPNDFVSCVARHIRH